MFFLASSSRSVAAAAATAYSVALRSFRSWPTPITTRCLRYRSISTSTSSPASALSSASALGASSSNKGISPTRSQPRNVLIVNKLRTPPVAEAIDSLLAHIRAHYPNTRVFHEHRPDIPQGCERWEPGKPETAPIDLIITLGGDGTILHASSLFKRGAVPPVLSFSMGTLGFLLPFHIDDFAPALESAFANRATVLFRMRLSCSFLDRDGHPLSAQPSVVQTSTDAPSSSPFASNATASASAFPSYNSAASVSSSFPGVDEESDAWQVMNEVALHRGPSPHLTTIETFVDNQHLTESISDGLIVTTPTGSTAYSLSAGGPIVHPSLSALVLTPICPRSLSFRPLVFPGTSRIRLQIGDRSRAPAAVSMDGQEARTLHPGESVLIRASPFPIPCINRSSIVEPAFTRDEDEEGAGPGKEDDWVRDINSLLQYNATFRSKALLKHER